MLWQLLAKSRKLISGWLVGWSRWPGAGIWVCAGARNLEQLYLPPLLHLLYVAGSTFRHIHIRSLASKQDGAQFSRKGGINCRGGGEPAKVKGASKWDCRTSTGLDSRRQTGENWRWQWGQEWQTKEERDRRCTFRWTGWLCHRPTSPNWWFKIKMNSALPDNNVFKNVDYGL